MRPCSFFAHIPLRRALIVWAIIMFVCCVAEAAEFDGIQLPLFAFSLIDRQKDRLFCQAQYCGDVHVSGSQAFLAIDDKDNYIRFLHRHARLALHFLDKERRIGCQWLARSCAFPAQFAGCFQAARIDDVRRRL